MSLKIMPNFKHILANVLIDYDNEIIRYYDRQTEVTDDDEEEELDAE